MSIHPRNSISRHSHARSSSTRSGRRGFTLIEILVVVAIIALLISILLPSLSGARRQARRVQCGTNLKTVGSAIYYYNEANRDYMPACGVWSGMVLQYIQKSSGTTIIEDANTSNNSKLIEVEYFCCPSDVIKSHNSSQTMNASGLVTEYLVSYAMSGFISFPFLFPEDAQEGIDFTLKDGLHQDANNVKKGIWELKKATEIKRPGQIVTFTDAGDDDLGYPGKSFGFDVPNLKWDFDDAGDNNETTMAKLEVHHENGNNFLYADQHVDYSKILRRTGPQDTLGVPVFPYRWVPLKLAP